MNNESEINFSKSDIEFKEVKNYNQIYSLLIVLFICVVGTLLIYNSYKKTEMVGQQECEEKEMNYSKIFYKENSLVIECYDSKGNKFQTRKIE